MLGFGKGNKQAIAAWTTGQDHQMTISQKSGKGTCIRMLSEKTTIDWKNNQPKLTISQSLQYVLIKGQ